MVDYGVILFVDHPKYYDKALNSLTTTIILDTEVEGTERKEVLVKLKLKESEVWGWVS